MEKQKSVMKKPIFLYVLFLILLSSCSALDSLQKCPIQSMLLTKNDFPDGTIIEFYSSAVPEMPEISAGFDATYGYSLMYHEVARFPWQWAAEKEFQEGKNISTGSAENNTTWTKPPELTYVSSFFQNYYVVCANSLPAMYQCRMEAQYHEYYTFFFAYIQEKGVTLNMFNSFLQKIDSRAKECE